MVSDIDGPPCDASQGHVSIEAIVRALRDAKSIGRGSITARDQAITGLFFTISCITKNLFDIEMPDCEDDTLLVLAFEDPDFKDEPNEDSDSKTLKEDSDGSDSKTLKEDSNGIDSKEPDEDDEPNDLQIIRAQYQ